MTDTHTLTVLCEECGEVIELKNVEAYVLAQHLLNACEGIARLVPPS